MKKKGESKKKMQPAHVVHFVGVTLQQARAVARQNGMPVEVLLAQAALETGWGRSVKNNAYFGIKGKSPSGSSTFFATHEYDKAGRRIEETDQFRAYQDFNEAAEDYASLIRRKYPTALASKDPEEVVRRIASLGYATDPNYAAKLTSIIRDHITPLIPEAAR